jgi:hypothetical protein
MKTYLLLALSSAALLGTVHVNASRAETAPAAQADRAGPADNQIADDVDAKIAKLKADLRLTADQENNWSSLQTTLHDYGVDQFKTIVAGRSARHDRDDHPNDIAMMRSEADRLTARAASLKKLADAADPLYGSLDDRQKHRLVQFMQTEFETR